MKTTVVLKPHQIVVKDAELPELHDGEALLRVIYAGVCGSDVHVFQGHHPSVRFPVTLGHEFVGEVVSLRGCQDSGLQEGDYVVAEPYHSCGTCDACVQARGNVCANLSILGVHEAGCFSEYIKMPVQLLYKIPKEINLKLAAILEPLAVAVHDVRTSNLKVGERAFIIGGGPIGILLALVARLSGASQIVISEINEYRLKFAQELGLTTINPDRVDILAEAMKVSGGRGFDVVYEATGIQPGYDVMTELVRIGGTIVIVGFPIQRHPVDLGNILRKELTIQGVRLYSKRNFAAAVQILQSGILDDQLSKMVDKVFPLEKVEEALAYSRENKEHFKILLDPSS